MHQRGQKDIVFLNNNICKTDAHYHIEAAQHDAGEVDMEEAESENVEYPYTC